MLSKPLNLECHDSDRKELFIQKTQRIDGSHTISFASAAVSLSPAISKCFARVIPTALGRTNELPSSGVSPMSEKGYLNQQQRFEIVKQCSASMDHAKLANDQ